MFRAVPLPIIRSLFTVHLALVCHTVLKTAFEQDQDGTAFHPGPARKLSSNLHDIHQCRVYSEQTPDDGQRNCPKHVEFHAGVNLVNWCIWLVLLQRNIWNGPLGRKK